MLWPSAVLGEIDQWAALQPDKPIRSDAILRLVRRALAGAVDKRREIPPHSLADAPEPSTPAAAVPPPEIDIERITAATSQTTGGVKWRPRLVGAQSPGLPKAPAAAKPAEDNKLCQMPEDAAAFNEYWKLAELMVGRRLSYEEVIVAYNSYRQRVQGRPVLLFTDIV